ncbi:MAG: NAD(P)/FAD-dependent oxidoreductase [Geminicoccaceae bacterium]
MRIAIVGSGIAGLSCAYLLSNVYDVTVYERADRPGGHSHTVPMPTAHGQVPVDTGFIVYNERNYPNLTALFRHLDVPTKASNMSFGVSLDGGRFEYSGSETYGTLFAQKSNLLRPAFHRMLADIIRFNAAAVRFIKSEESTEALTVGEFLDRGRYGDAFCSRYLLPMSAAIWSASLDRIRNFPARNFLRFFDNHGLISLNDRPEWRTVDGGSTVYVDKLRASFDDRLRLGVGAKRIWRDGETVIVEDTQGYISNYDAIILACHADQALALIQTPTEAENAILGSFEYQSNEAFLHSDVKLMPRRRVVWSSWNYLASSARSREAKVSITYWMNHLQRLGTDRPALVTLNPLEEPNPESVVAIMRYDHPLFDHKALYAQQRLSEIQGRHRIWFAGAHWGFGFHEDGLLSGLRVAAGLGVAPPWWPNVEPFNVVPATEEPQPAIAVAGAD